MLAKGFVTTVVDATTLPLGNVTELTDVLISALLDEIGGLTTLLFGRVSDTTD